MKTKELIGSMKINGRTAASTFSSDSKRICTPSGNGEVYVWDVNLRKCVNRFLYEGSLYELLLHQRMGCMWLVALRVEWKT